MLLTLVPPTWPTCREGVMGSAERALGVNHLDRRGASAGQGHTNRSNELDAVEALSRRALEVQRSVTGLSGEGQGDRSCRFSECCFRPG